MANASIRLYFFENGDDQKANWFPQTVFDYDQFNKTYLDKIRNSNKGEAGGLISL